MRNKNRNNHSVILKTELNNLKLVRRGKVRDLYDLGEYLLLVATDRISAFDFILPQGIPQKGIILNQISRCWFEIMEKVIPHHLISDKVESYPQVTPVYKKIIEKRSMLVKKTIPLPVECIVRGYLAGSGWKEYQTKGSVCGIQLPAGLKQSSRLPEPIFTPTTKAASGSHDENLDFEQFREKIGAEKANQLKAKSIEIYKTAAQWAEKKGIIIADTKFEFGICKGKVILIDELLTPDSSRFWLKEDYTPGKAQKSFDKQFVRDYLISINRKNDPAKVTLPQEIIAKTSERYQEIYKRIVTI